MADTKITDLTAATAAAGDELVCNRGGLDRKLNAEDVAKLNDHFTIQLQAENSVTPAAANTYAIGSAGALTTAGTTRYVIPVPVACTLRAAAWFISIVGTLGTAGQTVTHKIQKNRTTPTTGVAFDYNADGRNGIESGLSVSYAAGDQMEFVIVTPTTWTTPATAVRVNATAYFSVP